MRLTPLALLTIALACSPASASPESDALGSCLADHTSGKDRKDLARWVLISMGSHPEMRALSAATDAEREQSTRQAGALFTRLLSQDCAAQTKRAGEAVGVQAIQTAFSALGQLAMQELMSNPEVTAAMGSIERYVDSKKIEAALKRD